MAFGVGVVPGDDVLLIVAVGTGEGVGVPVFTGVGDAEAPDVGDVEAPDVGVVLATADAEALALGDALDDGLAVAVAPEPVADAVDVGSDVDPTGLPGTGFPDEFEQPTASDAVISTAKGTDLIENSV